MSNKSWLTILFWAPVPFVATATPAAAGEQVITISGASYTADFSRENGSIVRFAARGGADSIWRSGEHGLWQAVAADQSRIAAAQFSLASADRSFRCEWDQPGRVLRMQYRSAELDVAVTATGTDEQLDLQASIRPHKSVALELDLPARLRFDPQRLVRLVCPADGNQSVGTAFRSEFFKTQAEDDPSGWTSQPSGPKGYQLLYGGPLVYRPDNDPPVALRVTEEGETWLAPQTAARLSAANATVNRPPQAGQADLVVIDSEHGPYFSASHLGGKGYLWRIGGAVRGDETHVSLEAITATIGSLAAAAPADRTRVGLLALKQGPAIGNWSEVRIADWQQRLAKTVAAAGGSVVRGSPGVVRGSPDPAPGRTERSHESGRPAVGGFGEVGRPAPNVRPAPNARAGKVQFVELTTAAEMLQAVAADDYLAIVNPYGEGLPTGQDDSIETVVQAIGRYVRGGGNWFEVGGHPFHSRLVPVRFYEYRASYPPAFADFFHWEGQAGQAAVYRVQPRTWAPWQGATDPHAIFVPGRLACGGDEDGGWCERPFAVYVPAGSTWQSPVVRLVAGHTAADDLRAYCQANGITQRLEDKMPADVLDRFKNSVLLYYAGSCEEKLANLVKLPVPVQIHFADYLHGGFDKQYPDHLPPHPHFGTPEQFRKLFDEGHRLGHLLSPYTNPTWWCDGPKGPTFEQHGEAPLLKGLDGKPSHEQYGQNEGFTVCHWHPAVRAANQKTVEQFSREYRCDILFQDQCGARGWRYDTNPASPTVWAYSEGLLSMVAEDCRRKPLSTESGWDGVVNFESQLCGMSWSLVPTEHAPTWRQLMKPRYAPATWEIFPVAQYIAHDKAAMLHHDLGQFVTNRETLAWTLGLGFSLSYRIRAQDLTHDGPRQWLLWLDRLQKSLCSRYVGQPLSDFSHERAADAANDDDGLLRARYDTLQVIANLSPRPRTEQHVRLAPWGFVATTPGLVAASLQTVGGRAFGDEGISFVTQGDAAKTQVWVYARPGENVAVATPASLPDSAALYFAGNTPVTASRADRIWQFTVPELPGTKRSSPPPVKPGGVQYLWSGEFRAP